MGRIMTSYLGYKHNKVRIPKYLNRKNRNTRWALTKSQAKKKPNRPKRKEKNATKQRTREKKYINVYETRLKGIYQPGNKKI